MAKLLYRPFSLVIGVLGGMVAGMLFKRLWTLFPEEEEPPKATQAQRSWGGAHRRHERGSHLCLRQSCAGPGRCGVLQATDRRVAR